MEGDDGAHHIGGVVDGDELGFVGDELAQGIEIKQALAVGGDFDDLEPQLGLDGAQGAHHRVVLHGGDQHPIARLEEAGEDEVEPPGGVGREDDIAGVFGVDEGRHRPAGTINDAPRLSSQAVPSAPRVGADGAQVVVDGVEPGLGFWERG